jgi:hypothetical protein
MCTTHNTVNAAAVGQAEMIQQVNGHGSFLHGQTINTRREK